RADPRDAAPARAHREAAHLRTLRPLTTPPGAPDREPSRVAFDRIRLPGLLDERIRRAVISRTRIRLAPREGQHGRDPSPRTLLLAGGVVGFVGVRRLR